MKNPLCRVLTAGVLALLTCTAFAQKSFPTQALTIVVPFPSGNSSDIAMRLLGKQLEGRLGQAVVVENRAGAGGSLGMAYASRKPADGYTMVMGSTGPMSIGPAMRQGAGYDPVKSFDPIATIAYIPQVFVTRADSPIKDVRTLIRMAAEKPGSITYASSGIGSTQHLLMAQFGVSAAVQMLHVPYQGSQPAMVDVVSGRIDVMSDALSSVLPMIRSGRLKPIAVTTAQRLVVLPDVPTVAEQGVAGYDMKSWIMVFTPGGTPPDVQKRLSTEIEAALKTPELVKTFDEQAFLPMPMELSSMKPFVASEVAKWRKLVELSGAKEK